MKQKLFLATFFDNLKGAQKCIDKYNRKGEGKGRRARFVILQNKQGYFVVSHNVLKKVFEIKGGIL